MNENEILKHVSIILASEYSSHPLDKNVILKLVELFYTQGQDSARDILTINEIISHYKMYVKGEWKFPEQEVFLEQDPYPIPDAMSMVIDWSRKW